MAKEKATKTGLDSLLDKLEKDDPLAFADGEAAALRDKRIVFSAPRISWAYGGSFKLNAIHRFNGKESGGKTTLCTFIAGEIQEWAHKEFGTWEKSHVAILDYERSFDVIHAKDLGLKLTDPDTGKPLVHVIRKKYVEDGQEVWEQMMETGQICCTIYDSDAAGACHTELDNEIGKANFGALAKANGINIKRMNILVDTYCRPVLWISQERANQDIMAHLPKPTGGEAVNFFPCTRFRITQKEQITEGGEVVGVKIRMKNFKNKQGGIPYRECTFDVYFTENEAHKKGVDGEGQYLDMLVDLELIKQHGAWYYYREDDPDPTRLVKMQGWNGVKTWFAEHPEEFQLVKNMVDAKLSGFDEKLDKNSVETDEEVEFQKEQLEAKAKREKALAKLASDALSEENKEEVQEEEASA